MQRRTVTVVVLLVAVAAVGFYLKHYFSPAEVVKRRVADAVLAFEGERLLGVMSVFSRAYHDPYGFDYELLAGVFRSVMTSYDELDLELEITAIEVGEETIAMEVRWVLRGSFEGRRGEIVGRPSEPCTARVVWEHRRGWGVASATTIDIPRLRGELERRRRAAADPG